jgi:hypothetical protein
VSAAVLAVALGERLTITSEGLQADQTRGPARRADRVKWRKQEQDPSNREPSVTRTMTVSATVLRKRWKLGWKKPF